MKSYINRKGVVRGIFSLFKPDFPIFFSKLLLQGTKMCLKILITSIYNKQKIYFVKDSFFFIFLKLPGSKEELKPPKDARDQKKLDLLDEIGEELRDSTERSKLGFIIIINC